MAHRQVDEVLTALRQLLVVLVQAMIVPEPGQRPLDDPAMGLHRKAHLLGRAPDNLQDPAPQGQRPGDQSLVGAVGPELTQARETLYQSGQQALGPGPVRAVGRQHDQGEEQTERIHDQVALATVPLLPFIVAPRPPFFPVLTLWLSNTAALGETRRPVALRTWSRSVSCSRGQVPSRRQRR